MRETPNLRLERMTLIERDLWAQGIRPGGVDEAGRGPLAGPVVAACVVMPPEPLLIWVNDSKKLSPGRREKLYDTIRETALACGIGIASVEEIDCLNIRNAARLAMERAIRESGAAYVLTDAEGGLHIEAEQRSIVHGDAVSYQIAAASIVAKVYRDRMMAGLDRQYPLYGFAKHKGYGTAEHIAAILRHGPCPAHRPLFLRKIMEEGTRIG